MREKWSFLIVIKLFNIFYFSKDTTCSSLGMCCFFLFLLTILTLNSSCFLLSRSEWNFIARNTHCLIYILIMMYHKWMTISQMPHLYFSTQVQIAYHYHQMIVSSQRITVQSLINRSPICDSSCPSSSWNGLYFWLLDCKSTIRGVLFTTFLIDAACVWAALIPWIIWAVVVGLQQRLWGGVMSITSVIVSTDTCCWIRLLSVIVSMYLYHCSRSGGEGIDCQKKWWYRMPWW